MRTLTTILTLGAVLVGSVASSAAATPPAAAPTQAVRLGVYAGPDSKGVTGAAAFDAAMHQTSQQILDFEADTSWSQIEGPAWAVGPHAHQAAQFELSVPMLPSAPVSSLASCAAGADDVHWVALAKSLVSQGLQSTVIRPGWEMNGNWYRWSALTDPSSYAGCFRHLVTAMRSVAGGAFTFDWCVGVNLNTAQALEAWPGAGYVDYVGVDTYDTSWSNYQPGVAPTAAKQTATVNYLINGSGGLKYWSAFAASHQALMAVPEWGVSFTSAHGGGDDPTFVNAMFDFFTDPTNHVAFEHYFNTADHQLTAPTSFPLSATAFRTRAPILQAAAKTVTAPTTAATAAQPSTTASAKSESWTRAAAAIKGRRSLHLYAPKAAAAKYVHQYPKLAAIADVPQATWLGPDWSPHPAPAVHNMAVAARGRTIELVVYGIPDRDNGGYSAGGASNASDYRQWVRKVAKGVGKAKAIIVLEPDALGLSLDLSSAARTARERMLSAAVKILKSKPHARVYIDASSWVKARQQARLLVAAGIRRADGFALNTSGFASVTSNEAYGDKVSSLINRKHFVIDTSRAGQGGVAGQWCNPSGQGLGPLPQRPAGNKRVDALLWVKHPGESDGTCNGGPQAGTFWPKYALGLVAHADYKVR